VPISERQCKIFEKSTDYGAVKRYILQEMQLTPGVYLDKFQSVSRESTETYHQLSSSFDYYVESRKVGSYEELMELIVYDRIKASLPPFLSRHVLSLESSSTLLEKRGWLGKHALVEALDAYTAGMAPPSTGNKALGANSGGGVKPYPKSPKSAPRMYHQRPLNPGELPQTGQIPDALNRGSIKKTSKSAPVWRCFICRFPDHIALNCPKETAARQYKFGSSTPRAASNACMVEKVSTRGQLHHDRECKLEDESSDDIVVTKDTYHSAVDSEQSLMPDNVG